MMLANCIQTDGHQAIHDMLLRYAMAPSGTEVVISIGDVYEGPADLGPVAVHLAIGATRVFLPIERTATYMQQVRPSAEDYQARHGGVMPQALADIVAYADQVLAAIAAYQANEAKRRERAN